MICANCKRPAGREGLELRWWEPSRTMSLRLCVHCAGAAIATPVGLRMFAKLTRTAPVERDVLDGRVENVRTQA